jgi:hypothetical protein
MKVNRLPIALPIALTIAAPVFAGAWPQVGDQYRFENGTIATVAKVKVLPGVENSSVCLRDKKGTPCRWFKIGDLNGQWITYEGTPQVVCSDEGRCLARDNPDFYKRADAERAPTFHEDMTITPSVMYGNYDGQPWSCKLDTLQLLTRNRDESRYRVTLSCKGFDKGSTIEHGTIVAPERGMAGLMWKLK